MDGLLAEGEHPAIPVSSPKWDAWIKGVDPLLLSMLTSALAAISILTISSRPLCAATETEVIPVIKIRDTIEGTRRTGKDYRHNHDNLLEVVWWKY